MPMSDCIQATEDAHAYVQDNHMRDTMSGQVVIDVGEMVARTMNSCRMRNRHPKNAALISTEAQQMV